MTFLKMLLQASLTASLLIALAFVLIRLMGKSLSAKYRRLIWLVIALRLLIPIGIALPDAPLTVQVPALRTQAYNAPAVAAPQPRNETAASGGLPNAPAPAEAPAPWTPSLAHVLWGWGLGALCMAGYEATGHLLARRKIMRWRRRPDARLQKALSHACAEMGIRRDIALVVSKAVRSPMLIGLFRPTLVFPGEAYADDDLRLILRHELTHCLRHDLWYKLALLAARILHWFNPLVYAMYRRADMDMEFACDDAVLKAIGAGHGRQYGEIILAAAAGGGARPAVLGTHFHSGKKHLARRIRNIMYTKKRRIGAVALAGVLVAAIAGGALVGFASDAGSPAVLNTAKAIEETYGLLLSLRFQGYEDMTVSAFREAVHERMAEDEAAYLAQYDLYDEAAWDMRYSDEGAFFLFNTLIPLTAERWDTWAYAAHVPSPGGDRVPVEYQISREILDPDGVCVGEHEQALRDMMKGVETLAQTHLYGTPADEAAFHDGLRALEAACSGDAIRMTVSEAFVPALDEGLSDAVEPAVAALAEEEALTRATREDYALVLALKTDGHLALPLARFTERVQAAFRDEDAPVQGAYERIRGDIQRGDLPEDLTGEEKHFLTLTLEMTIREYTAEHQSQYSDAPVLPTYQGYFFGEAGSAYGVAVEYAFEYKILNSDALTVGLRNDALQAVIGGMQQHLADGLWQEGEDALAEAFGLLTGEHSLHGRMEITPYKLYYNVDAQEREAAAARAYALLQAMSRVDTSLSVQAYGQAVSAICEEAGTNFFQVMSDAFDQMAVDDPLYAFGAGSLMHTSSELFAAEIGGEERPYASDWVRREQYEDAAAQLEAMRGEMDPEAYEILLEAMEDEETSLVYPVYMVQANYTILYDIADPATTTIDQREARINRFKADMAAFMDALTEEALFADGLEERLKAELARLSAVHSDAQITVNAQLEHLEGFGTGTDLDLI